MSLVPYILSLLLTFTHISLMSGVNKLDKMFLIKIKNCLQLQGNLLEREAADARRFLPFSELSCVCVCTKLSGKH